MEYLEILPQWAIGLIVFSLRIVDVSIGTMRTIAVVQGRIKLSVVLGFFEVLLWLFAVSQVLLGATTNPMLLLAYAGGFAGGNAVGIMLEKRLALGGVVLRIISSQGSIELADLLRTRAERVIRFPGTDRAGSVELLYVISRRRDVPELIKAARVIDPNLFFAVEPLRESSVDMGRPLPYATGWRAVLKMK